jgi:ATP-dependent Clp protease adapter protein ClpS
MKLYIYNDNKNTFDTVINSLKRNLNYPYSQCVSIATIIHYSGKCLIKSGSNSDEDMIQSIFTTFANDGLTVKMEN